MPDDATSARHAVRTWNRGGQRPVLALHCSLAHSGAWSGLAGQLSDVTLTAPDLPGHGNAPDWDGVSDLHGHCTRCCVEQAETLASQGPIDIVGHSFGATVALRIALERPELVRSLVLIEPPLFAAARAAGSGLFAPFKTLRMTLSAAVAEGRHRDAAAMFHAYWFKGEDLADLPDRQQSYITDRIHLIIAQDVYLYDDAAGLLRYMGMESVGVPVLLIEGSTSPAIVAAIQDELARRLPHVSRQTVQGAGHMVPITHPAEVATAITAHLAGC